MNYVIPGGTPSKYHFDGNPKAGISGQEVTAGLPEAPASAGATVRSLP
jgi:hypothetical protein